MTFKIVISALVINVVTAMLTLLLSSCYEKREARVLKEFAGPAKPGDAEALWKSHERIMQDALAGKPYSIEEFGAACTFFTELTGIEIRGNGSYFGWLPNEYTAEDFERVRDWYVVNKDKLCFDEQTVSVMVCR